MGLLPTTNEEIPYSQELIDKIMGLRIIDDTFFRVFANDKYAITEIIKTVTGNDVEIIDSNPQVYLTSFLREGIVDSFNFLNDNSYCIIEMQNEKKHNDLKRCRFYSSLVTVNKTDSNMEFKDIPDIAVIYIKDYTDGDTTPLTVLSNGDGYIVYMVNSIIDDGSTISDLMKVITTSDIQITDKKIEDKYPNIYKRFNAIKRNKEAISAMCKVMEDYANEKSAERENLMVKIIELINKGLNDSDIMKQLSCTIEQISKMRIALGK